jgi:hypothetical protein
MATGYRAGTGVVSVLEETSWATKDGSFEANKQQVNLWNLNTNLMNAAIENQAARVSDLGKHEAGFGLAHESTFGFSTYAYGLGTPAGDGDTPLVTFCAHLLGACLGAAPVAVDGDTVKAASVPTTTSVPQTTAGNLAARRFLAHTVAGVTYVRPILSYATDTATLALALPSAPTPGDVLQGQVSIVQSEDAMAHVLQGDILKRNTTDAAKAGQMYEFFGSVGNFTLPEVGVGDAQTIDFEMRTSYFTRYANKARVAPTSRRPVVAAGGEFLLAKFGNTAGTELRFLNASVSLGRTYTADPAVNEDIGINGWVLTDQDTSVTITVHDDQAMPSGFSAANFPEAFELGSGENRWHLLMVYGRKKAGQIMALYFPCLQMEREPEDVDVNGLQAWKLTFSLVAGTAGEQKVWAALI